MVPTAGALGEVQLNPSKLKKKWDIITHWLALRMLKIPFGGPQFQFSGEGCPWTPYRGMPSAVRILNLLPISLWAGSHWSTRTRSKAARWKSESFLAPLHQTPSRRIALLFAARACDSKVSLLAGYVTCDLRPRRTFPTIIFIHRHHDYLQGHLHPKDFYLSSLWSFL